jgi:hypothetical protein
MGLLSEMVMRTYYEAQDKPIYMVRDWLGKPPAETDEGHQ